MARTDSRKANQRRRLQKRRQESRYRLRSLGKKATSPRPEHAPATTDGPTPGA